MFSPSRQHRAGRTTLIGAVLIAGGLWYGHGVFPLMIDQARAQDAYTDDTDCLPYPPPQCDDEEDNDGDGFEDLRDPGCHTDGNPDNPGTFNPDDNDEANTPLPQCRDKRDNDGDGIIDSRDPGCHTDGNPNNPGSYVPDDNDETDVPRAECRDGVDNDGDGKVDYPADPGCFSAEDASELDENGVTLDKSVDRDEAQPGEILTYTLTIKNRTSQIIRNATLDDVLLAGSGTVTQAAGARMRGSSAHWDIDQLAPGATRVLTQRLRIAVTMKQGESLINSARLNGSFGQVSDWAVTRIIQELPQTGIAAGMFGNRQDPTLRPFVAHGSPASSIPVIALLLWTGLAIAGTGVGTVLYLRLPHMR